jgi:hypothetical protein
LSYCQRYGLLAVGSWQLAQRYPNLLFFSHNNRIYFFHQWFRIFNRSNLKAFLIIRISKYVELEIPPWKWNNNLLLCKKNSRVGSGPEGMRNYNKKSVKCQKVTVEKVSSDRESHYIPVLFFCHCGWGINFLHFFILINVRSIGS